ncbi:hypothetical protein P4265_09360 [Bacillus velezensis]|uniref:hypothetical protein n=1 Tax=Bacillus amyloliquefaciens group TaxID=1938374 RepID=UPI002E249C20|nr:hypothetical protein [Bacillus velezensis]
MIHALANVPLSAEAKAVVAQTYCTGIAPEVSTVINLKEGIAFNREFLRELVIAGWSEQLGQYIEIIEARGATDYEALRLVQLAVRSGAALFAVCNVRTGSNQRCYLSIHHALADEQTLNVVSSLVQLAHVGMLDLALHDINQGRQAYYSYVERQLAIAKEDVASKELRRKPMKPVRLSESGRLAWSAQAKRVSLSRVVRIENADKLPITEVLALLCGTNVVSEGDTVCLSRCWRLPHESGAIGMMTGLIAMPIEQIQNAPTQFRTSLEARARHNSDAREALECCRASELFINGAAPRGIPASQVISATFPVGMDIRRISASEFRLEFEGQFCSKIAANDLLNELADILSDKKEKNK